MKNQVLHIIDQIAKDKGIDRDTMFSAIESAIISVMKKTYDENCVLKVEFNPDDQNFGLYEVKKVVAGEITNVETEIALDDAMKIDENASEGDDIHIKLEDVDLGRVSVQTVKQVIAQKMKEAEKEVAFEEFQNLKDEIIVGSVIAVERGTILVDLGKAEGKLLYRDQIPKEKYRKGDRITSFIYDVSKNERELLIYLSRKCPEFLEQLFSEEVPEIEDGIIKIISSSRDPGWRGKIAVMSTDKDIDPVGACVGVRGSRVQSVVRELSGERIDIVRWSKESKEYIKNALLPAQCLSIKADDKNKTSIVIVEDDQLYLAIGKKGQNVKLASILTGYKINILSKTEAKEGKNVDNSKQNAIESVSEVRGLNNELIEALINSGYDNPLKIAEADEEELSQVGDMGLERAKQIIESAKKCV